MLETIDQGTQSADCPSLDIMSPEIEKSAEKRPTVKGLEQKAELQRAEFHSQIKRYELRVNLLKGFTLFGSLIISVLALMDQSYFGEIGLFIIAIIGFTLAVLAFIDTTFSQSAQLESYKRSVKELTKFIRESHAYNKKDPERIIPPTPESIEVQFVSKYVSIIENSPDSKLDRVGFLQHKRIHEMIIHISKLISENPFNEQIDVKLAKLEAEMNLNKKNKKGFF